MADVATKGRGVRKERQGVVVSRSGNKSLVVMVETRKPHPVYGKVMTYTKKFHVHDEKNEGGKGDHVRIQETRPLSRSKRWRLVDVIEKAKGTEAQGTP